MALETIVQISDLSIKDFDCVDGLLRHNWNLIDNADGSISLVDGQGNEIDNILKSDITDNGDGTFTFTNNDGSDVTFDANSVVNQSVGNTDADVTAGTANTIATHINAGGVSTTVNETVTTLVDNGDGTITYTDEAGGTVTVDILSFDMDVTDVTITGSVLTFVGENGQPNVIVDLCQIIADNCTDSLVDNTGTSTITHTAIDGTIVVIDICTKLATCNVSALQNVAANTDAPIDCAFMVFNAANSEWEAVDLLSQTLDCSALGTH